MNQRTWCLAQVLCELIIVSLSGMWCYRVCGVGTLCLWVSRFMDPSTSYYIGVATFWRRVYALITELHRSLTLVSLSYFIGEDRGDVFDVQFQSNKTCVDEDVCVCVCLWHIKFKAGDAATRNCIGYLPATKERSEKDGWLIWLIWYMTTHNIISWYYIILYSLYLTIQIYYCKHIILIIPYTWINFFISKCFPYSPKEVRLFEVATPPSCWVILWVKKHRQSVALRKWESDWQQFQRLWASVSNKNNCLLFVGIL